jgi:hypothetical protein
MKTKLIILSIAALCFSAAPAMAVIYPTYSPPFGGGSGEFTLQQVLDNITVAPVAGSSSVNTLTDAILDSWDSSWQPAAGGSTVATMVIELSDWDEHSSFGIYDAGAPGTTLEIFDASDTYGTTGAKANLTFMGDGTVIVSYIDGSPSVTSSPFTLDSLGRQTFGFYLDATWDATKGGFWYSNTSLNSDNMDHMYAYQGQGDTIKIPPFSPGEWTENHFVLGWEDQNSTWSDGDYQDFVVLVESVIPVPLPAAVLLGILGLGVAGWKLRKFA